MKQFFLRRKREIVATVIIMMVFLTLLCGGILFGKTHFLWGTIIDGVNCSFLSVDEAAEEINFQKKNFLVTFSFSNGEKYNATFKELGIQANITKIEDIFQQQHLNPKASRNYNENILALESTEILRSYLMKLPELQENNMHEPQNAYIEWNGVVFSIHKEILGNVADFEDAMKLSIEAITSNNYLIDFTSITNVYPTISETDLTNEFNYLNSLLYTSINYKLSNGNVVSLDSSVICNWVYKDDNGSFQFDIENGVSKFIEDLELEVNQANSILYLNATDISEIISVNVPTDARAQLDKEAESKRIKSMLEETGTFELSPVYDRILVNENLSSYVELDISRQHLWFYLNGSLLLETDCVTGNVRDNYDTPTGVYYLTYKMRNAVLRGYNKDGSKYESPVEYWMPFYRGYGLHDASWRSTFGGNIYLTSGSHGCVNLPNKIAKQLYENIDYSMPIIIYQSKT